MGPCPSCLLVVRRSDIKRMRAATFPQRSRRFRSPRSRRCARRISGAKLTFLGALGGGALFWEARRLSLNSTALPPQLFIRQTYGEQDESRALPAQEPTVRSLEVKSNLEVNSKEISNCVLFLIYGSMRGESRGLRFLHKVKDIFYVIWKGASVTGKSAIRAPAHLHLPYGGFD